MKRYYEPVGFSSRSKMTDFLKHHFCYFTMNSWNRSELYACNLKIYRLWLECEIKNKLFILIQYQEFFDALKELLQDFAVAYQFTVGQNPCSDWSLIERSKNIVM